MASLALQFSLTALFVLAALASLSAIIGTWLSVKDAVFALRGDLARADFSRSYRYRITSFETKPEAAPKLGRVTRLPVRQQVRRSDPALIWPELRAAA